MPKPINEAWHKKNRMPAGATLDQKVAWHLMHAKECGCRAIPAPVMAEIARRSAKRPPGAR